MSKKNTDKYPFPYLEFVEWMMAENPATMLETVINIQCEYPLAIAESTGENRDFPSTGKNLRFLHNLRFQLECLVEDTSTTME